MLNEDVPPPGGSTRTLDAPADYLERYLRFTPAQMWQNLNVSPDFPTVGRLIADLYPQSGGAPIDGVIAVDPIGLSTLLRFTGPVVVPNWPVPIDATNVVDVTLRQAYDAFDLQEREDFLGDVAETVWRRATSMNLGSPARLARRFGKAGREGHLMLWFPDEQEQALAVRLGVAGEVPPLRSDSLFVNTQNASGNKVDYYLTRAVEYTVELRPDDQLLSAQADGQLEVRLDNGAPVVRARPTTPSGPSTRASSPGRAARSPRSTARSASPPPRSTGSRPSSRRARSSAATSSPSSSACSRSRPAPCRSSSRARCRSTRAAGTPSTSSTSRRCCPDVVSVRVEVPPGYRIRAAEGIEVLGPHTAGGDLALGRDRAGAGPAGDRSVVPRVKRRDIHELGLRERLERFAAPLRFRA